MDGQRLLTIGEFARASGLTAKALRHYDAVGLLTPALVDPTNNYRRYDGDQLPTARLVRRLRELELPLDEVRRLLALKGEAQLTEALVEHRRRLGARITRLQRQLHDLDHFISDGSNDMSDDKSPQVLDPETERATAISLFNGVWDLLGKEQRTPDEDARMIHMAHASCYHWLQVGEPVHGARGEWQCSRVYAVLGRSEPALFHARRVLDICQRNGIGDWDIAFAYEAMSRAHAVAGDDDEAQRWAEQARAACAEIVDDADREIVLSDLETLPSPA
ncbi:MAG: MerR family transcriptional regulator, thiopeptide resistance regulator [Actinomycetota bacterium]|jgi:DNA-binding transcriptional MerR regulator|nr:MerR family transcriptional regulator, thiopeptide resistance regulator [Actinomycetota bacterium]